MTEAVTTPSGKIWTKAFLNIFILNFIMSMGQFMMNTLVPVYAYKLGGAASIAGLVTGIFAVTALGIRPIAGPAMDYFPKNRILTAAIGLISLSFVFYGFTHNVPMLIAARLFHGLGMGFSAPISLALVSTILPREKMASGLGLYSLGSAISTAVGPTVGLKLSSTIGFNAMFFICAALLAICFFLSLMLKDEAYVKGGRFTISLRQIIAPEVILPTLVIFLLMVSNSCINSFIAIFGKLRGVEDIGLYFTASAVCLIFIRPLSGRIADKYGLDKTVIPGIIIVVGALVFISFCSSLPMFVAAGVIAALGFGISQPLVQTIIMQLVPKERRGAAGNTNFMGVDLGFLIGPTVCGFVITTIQSNTGSELLGFQTMYRIMVVPAVAAAILFGLSRKKLRQKMSAAQEIDMR
jgi:MFS family permease